MPTIFPIFVLLFITNVVANIDAQYLVEVFEKTPLGGRRPVARCDAAGASFGLDVPNFSFGISAVGCAISTWPYDACSYVKMPSLNHTYCINNFAIVPRGNCSFSEKAYFVQMARPKPYDALIIYNDKGKRPIPMGGKKYKDLIKIPVVMIDYGCMEEILLHYPTEKGYLVTLRATPGYYDIIKYLVPFVAIVGFCFIVLFVSLLIRICRERRRLARKRLSRSHLRKLPVKKWKKGEPEETCAICLEDFKEGEKLRILPCRHGLFNIDPWLTKNRKVCPICKRRVGPKNKDDSSDSDSDTRPPTTARENDSLLRNAQPIATSSSADSLPYPQTIPSLNNRNDTGMNGIQRLANIIRFDRIFNCMRSNTNQTVTMESGLLTPTSSRRSVAVSIEEAPRDERRIIRMRNSFLRICVWISTVARGVDNPHVPLNNDDTSTTTRDDLGISSRYSSSSTTTCGQGSGSSIDGHSMTTVRSNRLLVTVEVEPVREFEQVNPAISHSMHSLIHPPAQISATELMIGNDTYPEASQFQMEHQ